MKFIFALIATLFLAAPAWAVDVTMGSNGNLVFEPDDITIDADETIHFVNGMLPPHNIIVEGRADLSRESLMFSPVNHKTFSLMKQETMISSVVHTKVQVWSVRFM